MSSTISDGIDILTPVLIDGYSAPRISRNIVHPILGTPDPAVTLRPAGLRTGTLRIVAGTDRALCAAFEEMLSAGVVLTFADTDIPDLGMTFVVTGEITPTLDDQTRAVWTIECGFQEVA